LSHFLWKNRCSCINASFWDKSKAHITFSERTKWCQIVRKHDRLCEKTFKSWTFSLLFSNKIIITCEKTVSNWLQLLTVSHFIFYNVSSQ
jgi:hypothetical protein